jgi:uncharacterized protein
MNTTSTSVSNSQNAGQLSTEILNKMFGDSSLNFDLKQGTVRSTTDVRVIYLSSDIIRGIYDVLKYETGDAWSLILKNCGIIWGERITNSLNNELNATTNQKMGQLNVDSFIHCTRPFKKQPIRRNLKTSQQPDRIHDSWHVTRCFFCN